MNERKRVAHYVASTHWDREWYEPFQDYRFRLVRCLDEVLDVMQQDPEFRHFQTDGQSILLEDYLEARPEREAEIRALAAAGRFHIGPWYVMPDEFVVSGESLIRNMQLGLKTSAHFGNVSRVGFICDMFGHISQLPQILNGFGIDNAFLFRGTNDRTHGAIWRWRGADGSEVLVNRFPKIHGYTAYAYHVRKVMTLDEPFRMEDALSELLAMVEREKQRHATSSFLLFDGSDHIEIEPRTSELLRQANERLEDVRIVHSHLEAFLEDIRGQGDKITDVFSGELRDPAEVGDDALLLHGTLSSRMYLKQANADCENELCLWAEPFAAFADLYGRPYPHQPLQVAWRHLITNHAHDSMCGCSLDQVHQDMMGRFDQSRLISRHVTTDSLRHLALQVERPSMGEQDFAVVVFNPGSEAMHGPVDLTLRFPADIQSLFQEGFGYEPKISFRLYDARDRELPYQLVNQRWNRAGRRRPLRKFPGPDRRHEIDLTVDIDIPPYGYTRLVCRPEGKDQPTRHLGTLRRDGRTIENEYLRLRVQSNGSVTLTDKRHGHTYEDLLTFEDGADIGDGWYHGVPVNDEIYVSTACPAAVALIADGPHKATLKVTITMELPRHFRFDRMTRSEKTTPLRITSYLTLRRGSDHVEVRTVVDNSIRDHRLRVLLPTGTTAATYWVDSAFDVVERPVALRADNALYRETEVETKPQYTWTAVCDPGTAGRGLAVVSTGLPESAVQDLPDRPIALTLYRSFIKAFLTDGNEGGQMQGRHEFRYALVPLAGALPQTRLCRLGQMLAALPRTVQIEARDAIAAYAESLPPSLSFMSITPGVAVITAIHRQPDSDGTVVRMFNPTDEPVEETLKPAWSIKAADRVDLEGRRIGPLPITAEGVQLSLGRKQLLTVRLG